MDLVNVEVEFFHLEKEMERVQNLRDLTELYKMVKECPQGVQVLKETRNQRKRKIWRMKRPSGGKRKALKRMKALFVPSSQEQFVAKEYTNFEDVEVPLEMWVDHDVKEVGRVNRQWKVSDKKKQKGGRTNKHKKKKIKMVPHSGESWLSRVPKRKYAISGMTSKKSDEIRDFMPQIRAAVDNFVDKYEDNKVSIEEDFYSKIEELILLLMKLALIKDCKLFFLEVLSYCKRFTNKSIALEGARYLTSIFKTIHNASDDLKMALMDTFPDILEDPLSGESLDNNIMMQPEGGAVDFMKHLRNVHDHFDVVKNHPIFQKISYIISACVCMGLCSASSVTWNVAGMKLFAPDVMRKHVSATDMASAVMDTALYFMEGGVEYFTSGSLCGFLYSDKRIRDLNDDYNFLKSNFTHIQTGNLMKYVGIPETEFSARLDSTIEGTKMLKSMSQGHERSMLTMMELKLMEMRAEFQVVRTTGGLRAAPFVVAIVSESSQGKSSLMERVAVDLCLALGLDPDPKNFSYHNPLDDYDSSVKGNTVVLFADEIGNTKEEYQTSVPYSILMRGNNNVPTTAVKAELELKGKIAIEPSIMILSSNDPLLGAHCSKSALSVLRRVDAFIRPQVKPEFCRAGTTMLDPEKVALHTMDDPDDAVLDIWHSDVYEFIGKKNQTKGKADVPVERSISDAEGELKQVCYPRMMRKLMDMARDKKKAQNRLVAVNGKYCKKAKLCLGCGYVTNICQCIEVDLSKDGFDDALELLRRKSKLEPHGGIVLEVKKVATQVLTNCLERSVGRAMFRLAHFPTWLVSLTSPLTYRAHLIAQHEQRLKIEWDRTIMLVSVMVALYLYLQVQYTVMLALMLSLLYYRHTRRVINLVREYEQMDESPTIYIDIVATMRSRRLKGILGTAIGLAVCYRVLKSLRPLLAMQKLLTPQGNITPVEQKQIDERDKERPPWQKVTVQPLPKCVRERDTATPEQMCNTVFKNLLFMDVQRDDRKSFCDAFVLDTGFVLVPAHMVSKNGKVEELFLKFYRNGEDEAGGSFEGWIDEINCELIPGTDFALMHFSCMASFATIDKLLPEEKRDGDSLFVYKDRQGKRRQEGATLKSGKVGHSLSTFEGYTSVLTKHSEKGLCMGVYVSGGVKPCISGFHLAGTAIKSVIGLAGFLSRSQYLQAREKLSKRVFVTHGESNFPLEILGKKILFDINVHEKSPVNFVSDASFFEVYGSCGGGSTFRSRVRKSIISDTVEEVMGQPNVWGPPHTDTAWRSWHTNLDTCSHASPGFKPKVLRFASEDWLEDILKHVEGNANIKASIRPLTKIETINGVPGMRFLERINTSSSIGFPLTGPKTEHLVDIDAEGYTDAKDFTEEIWQEIHRQEARWLKGERSYAPCKSVIKDEPTKIGKNKKRHFYALNIGVTYHVRRLTLTLCRFFQMHPLLSECMVGINPMSDEWEQWVSSSTTGDFDACFAGDYKSFDATMPTQVLAEALRSYEIIMRATGNYSEEDFLIYRGVCTEILHPFIAFNGTLIQLHAGHISGVSLTVVANSTVQNFYKRCGFKEVEIDQREDFVGKFRDYQRSSPYGDDTKDGVASKKLKYWNMKSFAAFLKKHRITFTMPDKESELVEFMRWDDADFLKRTDAMIPELGYRVGKLDEMSIFKSLHSNLKSDVVSPREQTTSCMNGAAFEWFAHGREVYDLRTSQLKIIAEKHNLMPPGIHLSYDDRLKGFGVDSMGQSLDTHPGTGEALTVQDQEFEPEGVDWFQVQQCSTIIAHDVGGLGLPPAQSNRPGICKHCFNGRAVTTHDSTEGTDVSPLEYFSSESELTYSHTSTEDFEPQGGFDMIVNTNKTTEVSTTYSDYNPGYTTSLGDNSDATFNVAHEEDMDLKNFFMRPVKLGSFNWSVSAAFLEQFSPWGLYLSNSRVSNRMSNFKMLRGRLHVRFLINGNPFYYGLMIASYVPLHVSDEFFGLATDNVLRSQNPHLYLDPTTSTGGDMVLPFFWQYNGIDLVAGEGALLGQITMTDMVQLQHANGGVEGVTVTVMAWMEDVTLSGLTAHNMAGMIPQGGDEYMSNNVSDKAAALTRMAQMSQVMAPSITPYARATVMAASAVENIAKLFGMSKVNNIQPTMQMRPHNLGNLTNTNVGDATTKLSLDSKQELTIDPRTVGLGPNDEMALVPLAQRESFLFETLWAATDSVGTDLAYLTVTPDLYTVNSDSSISMTPSCWVTQPFSHWRGSMMVRIKVVASSFHKGRLRVSYDPTYSLADDAFNVVQNHIVDIAECKDFCFKIGWNSPRSYLQSANLTNSNPYRVKGEPAPTPSGIATNGTVKIEVFNELTTPSASVGNVTILVFTSMCDDFEVQGPTPKITDYAFFPPPGEGLAMVPEGGSDALDESTDMANAPCMENAECNIAPSLNPADETPGIYFGESINSWRQCLKRFNFVSVDVGDGQAGYKLWRLRRPNIPLHRGYAPGAKQITLAGTPYNYTKMTLLAWVMPAYGGVRGSLRYKYAIVAGNTTTPCNSQLTRSGGVAYEDLTTVMPLTLTSSEASSIARPAWAHTWVGAVSQAALTNPTVEAELPYQDNRRFWYARHADYSNGVRCTGHTVTWWIAGTSVAAHNYVAVGEDFSCFFFINTPPVYIQTADPVAY